MSFPRDKAALDSQPAFLNQVLVYAQNLMTKLKLSLCPEVAAEGKMGEYPGKLGYWIISSY